MTEAQLKERGRLLKEYVASVDGKGVTWGQDDCSTWPAQWVADITGKAIKWPVYSSKEEAHALIDEAGGLVALWENVAREAGIAAIYGEMPVIGDVGIIETRIGQVGGIFTFGGGICVRSLTGSSVIGVVGRHHSVRIGEDVIRKPLVVRAWQV